MNESTSTGEAHTTL